MTAGSGARRRLHAQGGAERLAYPLVTLLVMGAPTVVGQSGLGDQGSGIDTSTGGDCVGSWGSWSECDADCGGGVRERTFAVLVAAREGGRLCSAADGDTERMLSPECMAPCAVNCVGSWSDWSPCSVQCGGGVRLRTYSVSVAAAAGGAACEAENMATQETSCNVEACDTMLDCVGSWDSWSACSVPCGGGTRSRVYTIETREQNGGSAATCDIEASRAAPQVEACNEHACPISCRGEWGRFTGCEQPCADNAMAERRYTVTSPAAFGGRATTCVANDGAIQRTPCDRSSCPTNCAGYWGDWGECSVRCGDGGHRTRTYFVTQQAQNGGSSATCEAPAGTEESDDHGCNADVICPVDCEGAFEEWSACSTKCGRGTQVRTYRVMTAAAGSGRTDSCTYPNDTVEERECFIHTGTWGDWSQCSEECGGGIQSRVYRITTNQPCKNQTQLSVSRSCNMQFCWKSWQVAASASVALFVAVVCCCMYRWYETFGGKRVNLDPDDYASCDSSEEDQLSTLTGSEHTTRDTRAHRDLRLSIHGHPEGGYTSLSPIGVQKISPPTKEELDQQIYARANQNPAFAEVVRRSPYSFRPSSRNTSRNGEQEQDLMLEPRDMSLFDSSVEARSLEDAFDLETTTRRRADSDRGGGSADGVWGGENDHLERVFDEETTARSRTERGKRDEMAVAAVGSRMGDNGLQPAQEKERAAKQLAKPARSSWEERQLLNRGTHTPSSPGNGIEGQLDESLEEPLYPPPPPQFRHRSQQRHHRQTMAQSPAGHGSSTSRFGLPPVSKLTGNGRAISPNSGRPIDLDEVEKRVRSSISGRVARSPDLTGPNPVGTTVGRGPVSVPKVSTPSASLVDASLEMIE